MQSSLGSIYSDVPTIGSLGNVGAPDNEGLPRHRWYPIKEAYSPRVIDLAIGKIGSNGKTSIVDPFSGSGTTVLAGTLFGISSFGLEVNPFFRFVANTKLSRCRPNAFRKYVPAILAGINRGTQSRLEGFSTFSESAKSTKWLFNTPVLRAFEGGKTALQSVPSLPRGPLLLALIGAAMDNCNAVKDGKCLRYRPNWEQYRFDKASFREAFIERVSNTAEDLQRSPILATSSTVYLGDSRSPETWTNISNRPNICVTSPPYLNSFDYTDVYRPELFLGDFVRSQSDLRELRLRTVRSHVQVKWQTPIENEFGLHYNTTLKHLRQSSGLWNLRIPQMVQAYFEDIQRVLQLIGQRMSRRASIWIVVSTSAYAGIEIPVDYIIADIGLKLGWRLVELSTIRHLRRISVQQWQQLSAAKESGPHLRESLIALER